MEMDKRTVAGLTIVGLMIAASFFGVAATDAEWALSRGYWSILAVLFGLGAFGLILINRDPDLDLRATALRLIAHWFGVLAAVQIMFFLVSNDQITAGEAGLALSLILALGAFLCGVYLDWRLVAVGLALALVAPASALVQENVWIIIGLGILAFGAIFLVDMIRRRRSDDY
jgi:hypothetical protein